MSVYHTPTGVVRGSGSNCRSTSEPVDPSDLPAGARIRTAKYFSTVLPSLDFETYSAAGYLFIQQPQTDARRWSPAYKVIGAGSNGGGLGVVGVPAYVEHPTFEVLSLVYDLKDGGGRRLWLPTMPTPSDLLGHVELGGLLEAHNSTFEWYVWNLYCVRKLGWPPLLITQCRCSKAKAKRYSLPGGLDLLSNVLGTTGKDPEGTNLIRKLTVPHTPTKLNPSYRWTPATAWEDFKKLYKYNDQDVLAEDEVSAHIPDLTPYELATWITDQTINARGMLFDIETLNASLDVLAQAGEKYNAELKALTGGLVKTVNQNKKFIEWVQSRGVHTRSVDEEHREELLKGYLPPDVHRALDIARLIMGANIKKLKSIKLQLSSDNRLRNQYVYCGADRTGRWSGPMQSLTAEGPQTAECESCGRFFGVQKACPHCGSLMFHVLPEWGNGAVRQAKRDIRTKSLEYIEQIWVSPIEVLTGCIRGLIIPKPEHKFICCDFSAVEAVVAACVSRCQWRIDVFSTHGKIYEESAARATGISFEEILAYKKEHGRHHPVRNGIGKIRELAGGYGGWIGAWKNFGAEKYFNNDGEIKADVLKWREESPEIVDMWGGQYRGYNQPELFGLEGAFIKAILNPGTNHQVNDFTISVEGDTLYMQLPSGRYLYYHEPRLIETHDKMGRPAWKITFMGYNTQTKKGPKGWIRQETYGGRIFQNGVQAVAGDIHAEALTRCEQNNYPIVLDTHDEALAEVPDSPIYTLQRMVDLLEIRPYWASWWPIKATGWEAYEYGK